MPLNCPHAWEEYKKLDSAYDDLRREYLALRDEQANFTNVSKDWLVRMRDFRLRCLKWKKEFSNFIKAFDFITLITTLKRAEKIMGDQFYGPEEIKNALGFAVDKEKIPKIPYSPAELKQAKELGERLVLRISEDDNGNTMTMEHLDNLAQSKMTKDEGYLLYDYSDGKYKDEEFYKKSALRTEWKLVGGDFIEDSISKNYLKQTKVLRDYLKSIGALTVEEEKECSDDNLAKIANDAKKLAALEINQKHRRSPGEVLYDWFLYFKKFKDRGFLTFYWDWTNTVSSKGDLVCVGFIKRDGALVGFYPPHICDGLLGVVSVR